MPAPSDDELAFTPLLERMVDEVWRPGMPLRLIGVGMSGFAEGGAVQQSLFDVSEAAPAEGDAPPAIKDERKRRGLIEATDLVRDRFGEEAVRFGRSCAARATPPARPPRTPPTTSDTLLVRAWLC